MIVYASKASLVKGRGTAQAVEGFIAQRAICHKSGMNPPASLRSAAPFHKGALGC